MSNLFFQKKLLDQKKQDTKNYKDQLVK
jgi:hypothetical protein